MISNPLHSFSLSSAAEPRASHPDMQINGLDGIGQGHSYPIQDFSRPTGIPNSNFRRPASQGKQRRQSFSSQSRAASGASGPVRRRISRACDQCNQLRTKCDGQHPCAHCIEFGLGCEYIRERKKRGKASRKELAAQAAAQAAAGQGPASDQPTGDISPRSRNAPTPFNNSNMPHATGPEGHGGSSGENIADHHDDEIDHGAMVAEVSDRIIDAREQPQPVGQSSFEKNAFGSHPGLDLNGFGSLPHNYDDHDLSSQHYVHEGRGNLSSYTELPYAMQNHSPPNFGNAAFRVGNSPLEYGLGGTGSPGWNIAMASPPAQFPQPIPQQSSANTLRYPVLEPLMPQLSNILPPGLACDLIDLYFASSSSAHMHPMSPYVLGFISRKRSFLHPTKPRHCQPQLLASLLWVAAQTSDAPFLAKSPAARAKTCQRLLELTVSLLKPLIHTSAGDAPSPVTDGVALGGLGVAMPGTINLDALTGEYGPFGAAGSLDDVITYIHLAVVVSASEYKGASIRWWNAAWTLARELKLGRELPPGPLPVCHDRSGGVDGDADDEHDLHRNSTGYVTDEEREERRRIWWLLYIVDRHLGLCYNRPLFLLDTECERLHLPMDDDRWQSGDFGHFASPNTDPSLLNPIREEFNSEAPLQCTLPFECRGHSIFGYFLPLMTILGEIVDLHHAKKHPRFGARFRPAHEWDVQVSEITRHLEQYEQSLNAFQHKNLNKVVEERGEGPNEGGSGEQPGLASTPSVQSLPSTESNRLTESDIQTRIVVAYGTHVMHVLHILLADKWDPINLLDDEDLWISSQGFIRATSHAVAAAEAISSILEFDPGLEFMPFFFGIYLLQGSFLLLLIADKLQAEASPSVAKACETIVRAHEACVVTLSTEYQASVLHPTA